jgi:hypothetical protein
MKVPNGFVEEKSEEQRLEIVGVATNEKRRWA